MRVVRRALFFFIALACFLPLLGIPPAWVSYMPPAALLGGIGLALALGNPYPDQSKKVSKSLLQFAVVLLGFSMDLHKVIDAGVKGLAFALVSIAGVFMLGWALQRSLRIRPLTGLLVSTGTAICGGSAIAAMSTVTDAPQEDVSVAIGTVFLLNAVALLAFPPLGHALGMTAEQFGIWAGIAIHDVSSVVGAATSFDKASLETATAVKLSRVLYLVPITLIAASLLARTGTGKAAKVQIPWFIGFFVLASLVRTYAPPVADLAPQIKLLAVSGFSLSLFLIGAGISLKTLRTVGPRPLIQGFALWLFISIAAYFAAMV
jgi:uncharacterized integral membrane protein (TIGR00698 family)